MRAKEFSLPLATARGHHASSLQTNYSIYGLKHYRMIYFNHTVVISNISGRNPVSYGQPAEHLGRALLLIFLLFAEN